MRKTSTALNCNTKIEQIAKMETFKDLPKVTVRGSRTMFWSCFESTVEAEGSYFEQTVISQSYSNWYLFDLMKYLYFLAGILFSFPIMLLSNLTWTLCIAPKQFFFSLSFLLLLQWHVLFTVGWSCFTFIQAILTTSDSISPLILRCCNQFFLHRISAHLVFPSCSYLSCNHWTSFIQKQCWLFHFC